MDDDDFETWELCWEINQAFLVKRKPPSAYTSVCLGCKKRTNTWSSTYRSEFSTLVAHCPEGHTEWRKTSEADVCAQCNQDFVFRVSSRKQFCIIEGCRRLLVVDEDAVRKRLGSRIELLSRYLSFLDSRKIFECSICGEVRPLSEVPVLPATKCNHDPTICSTDLSNILEVAINRSQLDDLKCPDTQCRTVIAPRDVRKFVSPETFEKFNERITLETISRDPNFRWCQGTINGQPCTNGQIHPAGAEKPEWVCKICSNTNCFNCHPSICQRHIEMEDATTAKKLREISKVCPKRGCGRRLMRSGGCAHMTCKKMAGNGCGTEWCWSCKVIWVNGRPAHVKDCRWRLSVPIPMPSTSDPLYAPDWNEDPDYDTTYDAGLWIPSSYQ